jgi:hypothetical protein
MSAEEMRTMRTVLLLVAALGALTFSSAFVASYARPSLVESLARELIRIEVQRRTEEKLDDLGNTRIGAIAERTLGRNAAEVEMLKRQISEGLPARVAAAVAQMRDLSCECRKSIERRMGGLLEGRIADLARVNERLSLFIRTKYIETAEALTRELRVFTAANALMFSLLGLVTLTQPLARRQLVLPAVVLIGATLIVGGLYLFAQDWLHTLVFADYVGLAYVGWLAAAVALLADIAFNRARVCTKIINTVLHALGSAVSVAPC